MNADHLIPMLALLFAALFGLGFFLEVKYPEYLGFLKNLDLTKNFFK